jgi:hypothetical protein
MTKTESDYLFFPPPKSEYFFQQHWESEYFLYLFNDNDQEDPEKNNIRAPGGHIQLTGEKKILCIHFLM